MSSDDEITIDLGDPEYTITIDDSTMAGTYQYSNYSIGTTPGMNGTSGAYLTAGAVGSSGPVWTTNSTSPWGIGSINPSPGLKVTGDAEFDSDVKIKGVSIAKTLEDIQKRLAILVPDPKKLEHFESLQKAYQHYKTLEALCEIPETKDDGS